jgi:peptidoglycan/LPS O-acetylase OafA/YrhL
MARDTVTGKAPGNAKGLAPHLAFLDGVRGLAALYVMLHHIWLTTHPPLPNTSCGICRDASVWSGWLAWGHLAVAVFIVVSGFSLALGPQRQGNRLPSGIRAYLNRRAFRIIPPYWVALVVSSVAVVFTGQYTGRTVNAKAVVVHLLLVQNLINSPKPNGAFWSIAVEWQIYFVFPLLLLLFRKAGGVAMVGLTTVLVVLGYVAGSNVQFLSSFLDCDPRLLKPLSKLADTTPQFLALFAFGVAAAHVLVAKGRIASAPWTSIGAVLLAATVFVLCFCRRETVEAQFFWVDLLVGATAAACFAGFARRSTSMGARVLGGRVPHWFGQSSYSLYLIHAPVLESIYFALVFPYTASTQMRFLSLLVLAIPGSVLASRVFWWVFERPFMEHRSIAELRAALRRAPA